MITNIIQIFHIFLILKIYYIFSILKNKTIEKVGNIIEDNLFGKNEPIIIEYINNFSSKTKLFSKIFVKNNKIIVV